MKAGCPASRLLCEKACPERSGRVGFYNSYPLGILTSAGARPPTSIPNFKVILASYGSGRAKDFLPRNLWLPDECARLRKSRGHAREGRLLPGGDGRRGGLGALQHVLDPRQSGAEGLQPPL